jgi:hypothetical protein
MDALELDQVMTRPVRTLPFASRNVASSCVAEPIATVADAGATVTVATGAGGGGGSAVTVSAALPLLPSLVAVIVAEPAATPFTRPVDETVAIEAFEVVHVTTRSLSTLPLASRSVACSCVLCPTCTVATPGDTDTVATGAGGGGGGAVTVIDELPVFPSLVAVTVAEPAATPLTSPVDDTVATEPFDVVHVMERPVRTFPLASRSVATS